MNFDQPLAALFPGAAGRTVDALAKQVASGPLTDIDISDLANSASVTPEQVRKILTRLALLGLVGFPTAERVTIVSDHFMWLALHNIAAPQPRVDSFVRSLLIDVAGVKAIALAGPVAAGTAQSYPDNLIVALVLPCRDHPDVNLRKLTEDLSRSLGNSCTIVVATSLDEARHRLPGIGFRIILES